METYTGTKTILIDLVSFSSDIYKRTAILVSYTVQYKYKVHRDLSDQKSRYIFFKAS